MNETWRQWLPGGGQDQHAGTCRGAANPSEGPRVGASWEEPVTWPPWKSGPVVPLALRLMLPLPPA